MDGITLATKISDLLNDYDGMKNILIEINPKFKKLNNPILRRTLGRVASVKQAAVVGNMDPKDLVDQLRKAVGQEPICEDCEIKSIECYFPEKTVEVPRWADKKPKYRYNANEMLENDKNPLGEVRKALHKMEEGEIMVLEADFMPEPLIEEFHKDGHETYTHQERDDKFLTYTKK